MLHPFADLYRPGVLCLMGPGGSIEHLYQSPRPINTSACLAPTPVPVAIHSLMILKDVSLAVVKMGQRFEQRLLTEQADRRLLCSQEGPASTSKAFPSRSHYRHIDHTLGPRRSPCKV